MSNRPPAFVGSSNEGIYIGAPPSLIGNWPNNNGTIGAGKKEKPLREKDYCWEKTSHSTESL